jgi:hypothetical protein
MEVNVSFMPQPLYPQRRSSQYPMDRRLGGPQRMYGCSGEEKNKSFQCLCQESNPSHPAPSLVTLLTELHRKSVSAIFRII